MAYEYYFFDLDGTLTNPKEGITRSAQYALNHFGIHEPDLDRLIPFIGPPLKDSFQEFYHLTPDQIPTAIAKFRERFSTVGWKENEVLEGIPEMLEILHAQGKQLVLASSKMEEFVRRIMDLFDFSPYFCEIVGGSKDESRSKKKDVIQEGIRRLGLEGNSDLRDRILMVGDRKHDVEGAHLCGLRCMGIYSGFAEEGELEKAGAEYIVHSVEEMKEKLITL